MKRILILLTLVVGLVVGSALPALANNDPLVPGDDCSGNPHAIGHPNDPFAGTVNATDIVDVLRGVPNPVDGPASLNNPGNAEGAQGQVHAQCTPLR